MREQPLVLFAIEADLHKTVLRTTEPHAVRVCVQAV